MYPRTTTIRAALFSAILLLPMVAHADYWGQGNAAPATGDCNPAVQARQDAQARAIVDSYAALASASYTPMPAGGFAASSCLNRLMSSDINILFNPPSLSSILQTLENGVCQFATSLVTGAVSSLSQNVSGSLPLGDLIPGVNLGGLAGGVSFNPQVGTNTSGNPININGNSGVSGNLAGYWGSAPSPANSYGNLFGSGTSSATGSNGWFSGFFGN